ncbi:MAG: arginase family protein [Planctomycetota bacterium]
MLDLDGAAVCQRRLVERYRPAIVPAREWGKRIRIAATFRRFRRFRDALPVPETEAHDPAPIVLTGSGDFHHVTLALLCRLAGPVNLLVLDRHPDWMRGVPFLHCGTWLLHAARLAQVARVFHVGGDADFENVYYRLTPWPLLAGGKIRLVPAVRRLGRGRWRRIPHQPLRADPSVPADAARIAERLAPWHEDLSARPLYSSVDKDVLTAEQACTNWGSGRLTLEEVTGVLRTCLEWARGRLAGADLLGDWSPVQTHGVLATALAFARRDEVPADPEQAADRNALANIRILDCILGAVARRRPGRGVRRPIRQAVRVG